MIKNVSLVLKKGKILGIAGFMGPGRTEWFSNIVGYYPCCVTGRLYSR
jgi:ABC-type sugar transport system ATPase subunit